MRASLRARLHSAAAILCARDAGVGAVPVRPPTKSTLHDPSGFVGPHHRGCPPVKTRRPADCVATRTTGKCPKIRCFRGLRPLPGHPRVHRASVIVRHRPDRVRVRGLGHRVRDHQYHLVELLRRADVVPTKHASFRRRRLCSASKPVQPIPCPGRASLCVNPPRLALPEAKTTSRAAPVGLPRRRGGPEGGALRRAASGVTPDPSRGPRAAEAAIFIRPIWSGRRARKGSRARPAPRTFGGSRTHACAQACAHACAQTF